jgi:hypothetical protein
MHKIDKEGIGKKRWAIPGGFIPIQSKGKEPEFISHEKLAVLNTSWEEVSLKITIVFSEQECVGPFELKVDPQRVKKFRINDLIDPQAIPLGVSFGVILESDQPVVVQSSRHHTAQNPLAIMGTIAF